MREEDVLIGVEVNVDHVDDCVVGVGLASSGSLEVDQCFLGVLSVEEVEAFTEAEAGLVGVTLFLFEFLESFLDFGELTVFPHKCPQHRQGNEVGVVPIVG